MVGWPPEEVSTLKNPDGDGAPPRSARVAGREMSRDGIDGSYFLTLNQMSSLGWGPSRGGRHGTSHAAWTREDMGGVDG